MSSPIAHDKLAPLVGEKVIVRSLGGQVLAKGELVGYCDTPSVIVEVEGNGEKRRVVIGELVIRDVEPAA